jgi:hypothetical protein
MPKQFTESEKQKVMKLIKKFVADGFRAARIYRELTARNVKGPLGGPISKSLVYRLVSESENDDPDLNGPDESGEVESDTSEDLETEGEIEMESETNLPLVVYNLIYSPGMTYKKRIEMVRSYYDD